MIAHYYWSHIWDGQWTNLFNSSPNHSYLDEISSEFTVINKFVQQQQKNPKKPKNNGLSKQ